MAVERSCVMNGGKRLGAATQIWQANVGGRRYLTLVWFSGCQLG
jgi:hypothetical protein